MAKKLSPLSTIDIILNADAQTIREAYESRLKIDELLIQRTDAYEQIAQIEEQIETLVGEEGVFAYPAPVLPIAGFSKLTPVSRQAKPKPASTPAGSAVKKSSKAEKSEPGDPDKNLTKED